MALSPAELILMTPPLFFVGLDVGGSSMKAGVVDDAGRTLASATLPTEAYRGQAYGLQRMAAAIRKAVKSAGLRMKHVAAIGVVTSGTMDIPVGIVLDPLNLKPWRNVP